MQQPQDRGARLVTRTSREHDTIVQVGGVAIGGANFTLIAGPCAVETPEQINECARIAKLSGAHIMRGGCFKPRTSPYSFTGLGVEGIQLLANAGRAHSIPVVTEVGCRDEIEAALELVDMLQVGARNMQNFNLLRLVGRTKRPILLKRGMGATIDELLLAAEYIMAEGNDQICLCERGIRTFESSTRATLDISAVPVLRERTHLPIIVDPSHAAGIRSLVPPLARAAKAVGANGVMIEFHPSPSQALSDGAQALTIEQFQSLAIEMV